MATARRVELTIPEETWQRIEHARGDVPRAAWIKRAIQNQLPTICQHTGNWDQTETGAFVCEECEEPVGD